MNGIVSFDSNGTTIEGDKVTSGTIDCTTLNATDVKATGSLNTSYIFVDYMDKNVNEYITFISDVLFDYKLFVSNLWPASAGLITLNGSLNISDILRTASLEAKGGTSIYKKLKIGQDNDYTDSIYIGRAEQNILGTVYPAIPPRTTFYAVGDDDIANKKYVDSVSAGTNILSLTNIFTGTSNTFNNLIKTSQIDSVTPSSTYNLLTSHTGDINIGTTASEISLGSASVPVRSAYVPLITYDLCNKSYVDSVASGVGTGLLASTNTWTGASNTFNNTVNLGGAYRFTGANIEGITDGTTTYGIMNNITTASVRIGHSMTSGTLAIGNNKTSGEVNIMNNAGGTGNINIMDNGNGAVNLIRNSTTTAYVNIANTFKISKNNFENYNLVSSFNFCNNLLSTTTMNMGGLGTVKVCNSLILSSNSMKSSAINDTIELFNNITTGTVNLARNITTGIINIGTSSLTTSTINIGNLGEINIGTTVTDKTINIGGPYLSTGNVKIWNNIYITTNSIYSGGVANTINLFNNITTGTVNFCNGLTTGLLQIGVGKIKFGSKQIYGYTEYDNISTSNFTIPSTINKEYFIIISGSTPRVITLPSSTAVTGQIINIRNSSGATSHQITTFPSTTIGIFPTQAGSGYFQPAWSMPASTSQRFYFDGASWIGF